LGERLDAQVNVSLVSSGEQVRDQRQGRCMRIGGIEDTVQDRDLHLERFSE